MITSSPSIKQGLNLDDLRLQDSQLACSHKMINDQTAHDRTDIMSRADIVHYYSAKSNSDRENNPSGSVRSLPNNIIRVEPDSMCQQISAIVDEDNAQIRMLDD